MTMTILSLVFSSGALLLSSIRFLSAVLGRNKLQRQYAELVTGERKCFVGYCDTKVMPGTCIRNLCGSHCRLDCKCGSAGVTAEERALLAEVRAAESARGR